MLTAYTKSSVIGVAGLALLLANQTEPEGREELPGSSVLWRGNGKVDGV
jgi:hypothetical protein